MFCSRRPLLMLPTRCLERGAISATPSLRTLRLGGSLGHHRFNCFAAIPSELAVQSGAVSDSFEMVAHDVIIVARALDLQISDSGRISPDRSNTHRKQCGRDRRFGLLR